jgi:hypothetical protein
MSMMSNTGLNNRTRVRHYGSAMNSTHDLVVNNSPDLPLAVPLEKSSLP